MQYREEHRDLFEVNHEGIVLEFNRRWDMKNRLIQKHHNQEQTPRFTIWLPRLLLVIFPLTQAWRTA